MFNYSGGTSWNKSAEGYTFWHNVMSDLGRTVSYSGISNTFSSTIFNTSLIFFGISIIIIYLSMGKRLLLTDKFIFFITIFGIISGIGIIGVGLTPDDILSDERHATSSDLHSDAYKTILADAETKKEWNVRREHVSKIKTANFELLPTVRIS